MPELVGGNTQIAKSCTLELFIYYLLNTSLVYPCFVSRQKNGSLFHVGAGSVNILIKCRNTSVVKVNNALLAAFAEDTQSSVISAVIA